MSASSFEAPLDTPADWAVLADWLSERGDPRGEWLQLEQHLTTLDEGSARAKLRARLIGEFQPIGVAQVDALNAALGPAASWLDATWRCGLLVRARLSPDLDAGPAAIAHAIATLLDSSASPALGRLHLGDASTSACRLALASGPARPNLHALVLGDFREPVGPLAPLATKLANLRTLELRGPGIALADAALPHLHTLSLHCEEQFDEPLRVLGEGSFTKLRSLHLRLGGRRYADLPEHLLRLATLLSGSATPELEQLGLTAIEFADALIGPLADSPLLCRLSSLDLSDSWLTAAGADLLLDRADAFEHLRLLELASCHVPAERELALRERFGERVHLGLQVRGMTWDPVARAFDSEVGAEE
ncbi:hypothetical protein ACNOYE_00715 [Nannocystaceae bacterium ST9]